MDRKSIKSQAKQQLKKHYVILCLMCALSIFLGTEFASLVTNAQSWYDLLLGSETELRTEGLHVDSRQATAGRIADIVEDAEKTGKQEEAEQLKSLLASAEENPDLSRQRGVFAALVNNVLSGHLITMAFTALHSVVHSDEAVTILMILISFLMYALVFIFFKNVISAVVRRAFLETRLYDSVPMGHLLYFGSVRRWLRVSLTLLLRVVQEMLWSLTIVGGLIKRYSYFLVSFIVAENPEIKPREAIALSRRMMNGHKWECFLLDLSFIGWDILGYVTFGVAEVLWVAPYRIAAYTAFYAEIRAEAKKAGLPGTELLNDRYLYETADLAGLRQAYADIAQSEEKAYGNAVKMKHWRRVLAERFGIWIGSRADREVYCRQEGLRYQMRNGKVEMEGRIYPERLSPRYSGKKAELTGRVSFLNPYSLYTLILSFFIFSFIGWIWEVCLTVMVSGELVNRGALHGPWLPIYGGGVLLIAVLLYRFREKPMLEAVAIMVLCGVVEYTTSYVMELSTGARWWDYTGYFLNLNGRICGEGLSVFAIAGMMAIYLLIPLLDSLVSRMSSRVLMPVSAVLLTCFFIDLAYSSVHPNMGEGITDDAWTASESTSSALKPLPAEAETG